MMSIVQKKFKFKKILHIIFNKSIGKNFQDSWILSIKQWELMKDFNKSKITINNKSEK